MTILLKPRNNLMVWHRHSSVWWHRHSCLCIIGHSQEWLCHHLGHSQEWLCNLLAGFRPCLMVGLAFMPFPPKQRYTAR